MAIRRLSTASIKTGSKSNKLWDQDTAQGAMVPIASVEMNGTATAFGFGSIPQIYQDLVIVTNIRSSSSAAAGWIINNNPSGATYGVTTLKADGTSATSVRGSAMSYGASQIGALGSSSGTPATMIAYFFDYTNSSRRKTWLQRTSSDLNGSGFTGLEAHTNSFTAAITDIACSTANAAVLWTGSITLYGIKASA